jgi:hypothetical protein
MGRGRAPGTWLTMSIVAALVLLCGCAGTRAGTAAAPAAAAATTAGQPVSRPGEVQHGLLGSRPATLDAARNEAGRQPVAVRVPGYPGFSPVRAFTTDPVTGGLDLPKDARTVAWWSPGALPGDARGTVVLAAHVSYNGRHGPFTRLDRWPAGAIISVRQADGVLRDFRVAGERRVVKSALDREDLFRTTGPPRLALITCGGTYDRATRNFSDNIIVYAVPTS